MKIIVTRPRQQSEELITLLRAAGHEAIPFPVIEICPLDDLSALDAALQNLADYTWIIFTSTNAVEIFCERLPSPPAPPPKGEGGSPSSPWQSEALHGRGARGEGAPHFAAIGPKTAAALRRRGLEPAFIPAEAVAENILPGLGNVRGQRVLLPQSEIARPRLAEAIRLAGGLVDAIPIYRTLPVEPEPAALAALAAGVDAITFTSPSTVENFVTIARRAGLDPAHLPGDPVFACIGPVTRQAAEAAGLPNIVIAEGTQMMNW